MRNFKLFNHWIAELRDIARAKKVSNEGEKQPMKEDQLKAVFSKENFLERFEDELTPEEAFIIEMDLWEEG